MGRIAAVLLAIGLTAAGTGTVAAQEAQHGSKAIAIGITCAQMLDMMKVHDIQSVGIAILWLDGIYSGKSGKTGIPDNWGHTLGQAVGGTCAIDANASRTVLDVVGEVHEKYAPQK